MLLAVHRLVDSVHDAHYAARTVAKKNLAAALDNALKDTMPAVKLAHEEYRVLLVEAGGIWSKEDTGWLALAWAVANDVVSPYMMSNLGAELDQVTGAKTFARIRKESRDTLKRLMVAEGPEGLGERLKTGLEVAERIVQGKLQLE
jgi:hypothetical protein